MNKINCYHSLLNEVMLKKSLIFLGNLFIEKKNIHSMDYGMGINLDKLCPIIILQFPGTYLFVSDNLKVFITDYMYIF